MTEEEIKILRWDNWLANLIAGIIVVCLLGVVGLIFYIVSINSFGDTGFKSQTQIAYSCIPLNFTYNNLVKDTILKDYSNIHLIAVECPNMQLQNQLAIAYLNEHPEIVKQLQNRSG